MEDKAEPAAQNEPDAGLSDDKADSGSQPPKHKERACPKDNGSTSVSSWPHWYEMNWVDARYRGHVVIISNEKFHRLPVRAGTENDVKKLEPCFTDVFGFDKDRITVRRDLTASEMAAFMGREVPEMLHDGEFKCYPPDCFVCVILTHGDTNDFIYGIDGNGDPQYQGSAGKINLNDLIKPIQDCDILVGKPKIFLIQACKGDGTDEPKEPLVSGQKGPSQSKTAARDPTWSIPSRADTVVLCATSEGHMAWRKDEGSYFIQNFCKICSEDVAAGVKRAQDMEFLHLSTYLNYEMAKYSVRSSNPDLDGRKQMPFLLSTLTKLLYFKKK